MLSKEFPALIELTIFSNILQCKLYRLILKLTLVFLYICKVHGHVLMHDILSKNPLISICITLCVTFMMNIPKASLLENAQPVIANSAPSSVP